MTGRIATLRGFSTMSDLIFYAHSAETRIPTNGQFVDGIYSALLRELSWGKDADLLHSLLCECCARAFIES